MKQNFTERINQDEALDKILEKIEEQQGCQIKRICRSVNLEGTMHFTAVMVDYTIIEVALKGHVLPMISEPILEVAIEAF